MLHKHERRTGLSLLNIAFPVAILVCLAISVPNFATLENLTNINSQITALLIVSLGQLIVALSAGIDLSVGSLISLTSAALISFDPSIALPFAFVLGIMFGLANGIGIAYFRVHPLIMTLATGTFGQGLAFLISPVPGGNVPAIVSGAVRFDIAGIPGSFFWCLIFVVVGWLIVSRSVFGLRLFAIGGGADSAALNGVQVVWLRIAAYVTCSLSAVFAGLFLTARVATGDPTIGAAFSLDSVTAIALGGVQLSGGVGSVPGVILGTVTLGLMSNGMNMIGISPFFRAALTGVLLLGAISFQRRTVIGV